MTDEKGEKRQSLIDSAFNASPPLLPGSLEARQARAANRQQNHPLNQLRAEISRGGLPQSNRFQMNINPPPTLASESPEMLRRIMIRKFFFLVEEFMKAKYLMAYILID